MVEDAIADKNVDIAKEGLAVVIDIEPQNEAAKELKKQLLVAQKDAQGSAGAGSSGTAPGQDCTEPSQKFEGIEMVGSGTGFAINEQGYAVTNDHVVSYEIGEEEYLCDALQTYYKGDTRWAKLVQTDEKNDLAIIRTCRGVKNFAQLRSDRLELEEGESVAAFGYPLFDVFRAKPRITDGIVSSLSGFNNDSSQLQHTAAIQPGNSGGPLLDLMGHVVGVNRSTFSEKLAEKQGFATQSMNFAVKSRLVRDFLESNEIPYKNADAVEQDHLTLVEDFSYRRS